MSTACAAAAKSSAADRAATVAALRRKIAAVPARPERALSAVPDVPDVPEYAPGEEPDLEPRELESRARATVPGKRAAAAAEGDGGSRSVGAAAGAAAAAAAGVAAGVGRSAAIEKEPLSRREAEAVAAIPLPENLRPLVAGGTLTPGQTVVCAGGHAMLASLLAAATAASKRCAVVGYPELALAAVAAEGGDLAQLALVPAPGADPGAVVSVLLDGMDLVLLDPTCGRIAPSRARVLAGRARTGRAVLLVGAQGWPAADLRLDSGAARAAGLDRGYGRITVLTLPVRARGKGFAPADAPVAELRQLGWNSRSVADLDPTATARPALAGGGEAPAVAVAGDRVAGDVIPLVRRKEAS